VTKRERVTGVINTYGAARICKAIDEHFTDAKAREKGYIYKDLYNFLENAAEKYTEVGDG
jgi:hypothetical protein